MTLSNLWAVESNAFGHALAMLRAKTSDPSEMLAARVAVATPVANNVAVIPIRGFMVKDTEVFGELFGETSMRAVTAAVNAAAADNSVKSILLIIDSPGGSVDGLAELEDAVFAARKAKTVIAQVDGTATSAAYWIAAQAEQIFAHRLDVVGSIGVSLVLYDFSKMFEADGIRPVVIDTGEFKSAAALGTEITESQEADFQRVVDGFFSGFVQAVSRGRKLSTKAVEKLADGRVFLATDAVNNKLIDGIQPLSKTIRQMAGRSGSSRRARARRQLQIQSAKCASL